MGRGLYLALSIIYGAIWGIFFVREFHKECPESFRLGSDLSFFVILTVVTIILGTIIATS